MTQTPNPWLILLNDFCHDLFTGLWCGAFLTLWLLHGRTDLGAAGPDLLRLFTGLCLGSLLMIIATGVFRATYYRNWDGQVPADIKKRLLLIKHALLGSLMLGGSALVAFWALA